MSIAKAQLDDVDHFCVDTDEAEVLAVIVGGEASSQDAAFFATAREAMPALLDEVERLRATRKRVSAFDVEQKPCMSCLGHGWIAVGADDSDTCASCIGSGLGAVDIEISRLHDLYWDSDAANTSLSVECDQLKAENERMKSKLAAWKEAATYPEDRSRFDFDTWAELIGVARKLEGSA